MLKLNFRNTDSMIIGEENGLNLSVEFENYIQNHHENIVLTSETMRGLEIFSQEGDGNQQFSQGRFLGTYSNQNADNIYLDNNPEIAGGNIHNLSTCLKSEILIRAP